MPVAMKPMPARCARRGSSGQHVGAVLVGAQPVAALALAASGASSPYRRSRAGSPWPNTAPGARTPARTRLPPRPRGTARRRSAAAATPAHRPARPATADAAQPGKEAQQPAPGRRQQQPRGRTAPAASSRRLPDGAQRRAVHSLAASATSSGWVFAMSGANTASTSNRPIQASPSAHPSAQQRLETPAPAKPRTRGSRPAVHRLSHSSPSGRRSRRRDRRAGSRPA
jgi:hypothetical protein